MGEYIQDLKSGETCGKLGTCEDFMYVRADDCASGRLAYRTHDSGRTVADVINGGAFFFRFPWPDEDNGGPFWDDPFRRFGFTVPREIDGVRPFGEIEHKPCYVRLVPLYQDLAPGYIVNGKAECPNREPSPYGPYQADRLVFTVEREKRLPDGMRYTVFGCAFCGEWFRLPPGAVELIREHGKRGDNCQPIPAEILDRLQGAPPEMFEEVEA